MMGTLRFAHPTVTINKVGWAKERSDAPNKLMGTLRFAHPTVTINQSRLGEGTQ
jgi:hypothetical protein